MAPDLTEAPQAVTLRDLTGRIGAVLATASGMAGVWVTAETSDLRVSGGHCYMELLQKDDRGAVVAKARAVIWASTYMRLAPYFQQHTGSRLASDMKVMVRVSVNFHNVYGLSLVIADINPTYTAGDLIRRRAEIVARLKADGIFDLNRTLPWPRPASRVAVISAAGAAGYGDFTKHLYSNGLRLRFSTELFEAPMQGERAPAGIIAALERIAERADEFDCVVIIRGGGAVSDLACFDHYELAANIAQFPLPVVVGIGHERDETVLDYVANARVKTPTAAAELLIAYLSENYEYLVGLARSILSVTSERLSGQHRQLEYYRGQLPALVRSSLRNARQRLEPLQLGRFAEATAIALELRRARLKALAEVLDALSPVATLKRGYTITRVDGRAVTDASSLAAGAVVTTTFARGAAVSKIEQIL